MIRLATDGLSSAVRLAELGYQGGERRSANAFSRCCQAWLQRGREKVGERLFKMSRGLKNSSFVEISEVVEN
jgi:hypothetical protein